MPMHKIIVLALPSPALSQIRRSEAVGQSSVVLRAWSPMKLTCVEKRHLRLGQKNADFGLLDIAAGALDGPAGRISEANSHRR
jgi:hypothetical protein